MRKFQFIIFSLFIISSALQGQESNVTLLGRWGKGNCEAVTRRGKYTFIGNGGYLEVLRNQQGSYEVLDQVLLPGPVEDIWVQGDTTHVYVACGDKGLQVVYFNYHTNTFSGIIGTLDTPGYAQGVMQYGTHVFVADGNNGLVIINVGTPSNPQLRGTFSTAGSARDVWVLNSNTVLVTADSSGLYSVDVSNRYNPVQLDLLTFSSVFPEQLYPGKSYPVAYQVLANDTVAYVAAGWGGMRTVNIKNPSNLYQEGRYVDNFPVDVRSVWIAGDNAYLACGDYGIYGPLDVSDPAQPETYGFLPLDTDGFASTIVIDQDTAFVGDADNGHLIVDVREGFQPSLMDFIETAANTYGATIETVQNNIYGYIAAGRSGVKTINLNIPSPPNYSMNEMGSFNTPGEARRVLKKGSWLYVADGSYGLTVIDALVPTNLVFKDDFPTQADTCYDVDVLNSTVYLTCGDDGLRLINFGTTLSEMPGSPIPTPGNARAIKIVNSRAYVALLDRVNVYDITNPPLITQVDAYTTSNIEAVGIDVSDDKVFIANGQFGFVIWDLVTDNSYQVETGGFCTDIVVKEKTIYITDSENGLRIFDFSKLDEILEVGYYDTGGKSEGLAISGDIVCVADGGDGLYVIESEIRPEISLNPTTLIFGPVSINKSRPLNVWIQNTGTTLLKIEDIVCAAEYDVFFFDEESFSVAPGETHKLVVHFAPFAGIAGLIVGSANIYSNAGTVNLSLQGRAVSPITEDPYLRDDLTVALWHFDEASGITVEDVSLNNLDGQLSGTPSRVAAKNVKFNRAVFFDGVDDRMVVPYNDTLNFSDHAFTVELWFRMESKPVSNYILLKRGVGSTLQYELALASDSQVQKGIIGRVQDASRNIHTLDSGSMGELSVGQWYHIALTWDMDSLRLYVNSVLRDVKELRTNLLFENTENLGIGASVYGNAPFHGTIDEVRISNIARQSWEFHVNRSHIVAEREQVDFGSVLIKYSRTVPFKIRNGGSQILIVSHITTTNSDVSVTNSTGFSLVGGQDSTIWLTFTPESENPLGEESNLVISSSDPTFPDYTVPLIGQGVSSLPAGAYESDVFTAGLWHFGETSGNTVIDASGHHLDGTWNGAIRPSGKFDLSLWYDGLNDFCRITPLQGQDIRPEFGGFTVEGWFYFEDILQDKATLIKRQNGSSSQFHLYAKSDTIVCEMVNTLMSDFSVSSDLSVNIEKKQWYHIAGIFDGDSLYLYVNGNKVDATRFIGQLAGTDRGTAVDDLPVFIGGDEAGENPFYGKIDEVRISSIDRQPWEFNVEMARVEVSSTQINFGSVLVGEERTLDLWIKNSGIDLLVVNAVYSSVPTLFHANMSSFNVLPGDSQLVEISYEPSDDITQTGQLTLETNDPFWHFRPVYLEGRGIENSSSGSYTTDLFTYGLFHFNQSTGTTLTDASGLGLNGTLKGGVSWADSGRFVSSLRFDGVDGRVEIPYHSSFNVAHSDFTLELWFLMIEKPQTYFILLQRGNSDSRQFELALGASEGVIARVWDADSTEHVLTAGPMNLLHINQWYHVAVSWDGDSLKLFLNNEVRDVLALSGSLLFEDTEPLMIGASSSIAYPFHGYIDEMRISLTARQSWEFNVLPPDIDVSSNRLNFATVYSGQSRTLRFGVTNQGDQDLIVTISGASSIFTLPDSVKSFTLPRIETKMIPVTYIPSAVTGTNRGVLTITSNDTENPENIVNLEGSVTGARNPWPYQVDVHTLVLYHCNEGDIVGDTLVIDASGGSRNGNLGNGTAWSSSGYYGGALSFDGVDDWIVVYADIALDPDQESYSIELLFKTDTLAQTLVSKGVDEQIEYRIGINNTGKLEVEGFGSGGPQVNDDSWHHLAFVYDHLISRGKLYLDGNLLWTRVRTGGGGNGGNRPLLFGTAEKDTFQFYNHFEGLIDEIRISDIVREPWEFQLINYGIEISSLNPTVPTYGSDLLLTIHVPVNLAANTVAVYYRSGGSKTYTTLNATGSTSTYQVTIPAEDVTLRGLEYYVKITSGGNNYTYPAMDPVNNPIAEVIQYEGMEAPITFPHQRFQMFSVPVMLDTTSAESIFEDDFGPYDPYQWRLFKWDRIDTAYIEYNNVTQDEFQILPGSAYWMITDIARTFDIGGGQTVTTDSSYRVYVGGGTRDVANPLNIIPGWNMISNPYNFTIQWDDCSLSSDTVTTLYYWNGETFLNDVVELEPWKGYFICNQGRDYAMLSVLPKESEGIGKKSMIQNGVLSDLQNDEWMYRISVSTDGMKDLYNYAGIRRNAKKEWDLRDQPEPPPIGEYISGFFKHSDWEIHPGIYTSDIRNTGEEGYVWEFTVESQLSLTAVTVNWLLYQNLPQDWEAYFFDLNDGIAQNMFKQKSVKYETQNRHVDQHIFKIVVGTKSFIESQRDGIPLEPIQFNLHQNYPNPFNPKTTIRYSLPKNSQIEMVIFNAIGQQVRVLFVGTEHSGHHEIEWDGKDDMGQSVSSGVYICRLKASEELIATRKMIILR